VHPRYAVRYVAKVGKFFEIWLNLGNIETNELGRLSEKSFVSILGQSCTKRYNKKLTGHLFAISITHHPEPQPKSRTWAGGVRKL
jgi:hypothetical protein